ncbi:hypothetical protein Hanom_Chr15g01369651 [Helianthus anomalus]
MVNGLLTNLLLLLFFQRPMNPPNGLLAKFTTSGYTCIRTGENIHLGPKPVNTLPKARHCGEVRPAQFKDRTSDLRLISHHHQVPHKLMGRA